MMSGAVKRRKLLRVRRKREPWFYLRLEAYSFFGFSEGA